MFNPQFNEKFQTKLLIFLVFLSLPHPPHPLALCIYTLLFLSSSARGYKTFFMLNSTEHEILNAHKYKNIKKFGFFKFR